MARLHRQALCHALERGDAVGDRQTGVEQPLEPPVVVAQRVVDAHSRCRVVGPRQRKIVGFQGAQRVGQACGVVGQLDAAGVGQGRGQREPDD
jgi:hypothetical protein